MEVFGDPERGDATARLDQIVESTARQFIKMLVSGSQVINRPVGSKVLSPTEKREEYVRVYKGNPEAFNQAYQQYVTQHGAIKGSRLYSDWVVRMERETQDADNN